MIGVTVNIAKAKKHFSELLGQVAFGKKHILIMELRFGSALRDDFEVFWEKINKEIISRVKILPIGEKEALVSGDILADLPKTGQSIGVEDVLIAASALTNQCTIVTVNTRHFSRIKSLKVENWREEKSNRDSGPRENR